MRSQMQLAAPLIIVCSALLLCIGVIAGLTGSLILQASNSGRAASGGVATSPPPATVQTLPTGNALLPAVPAANLIATNSPVADPTVPAAPLTPQQDAAVAASSVPPVPTAEAPQPSIAPAQETAPMVGAVTSAAEAQGDEVDPATFQQDLQPMGQWVTTSDYGTCWAPQGVAVDWRPYTAGRWVYTECGWTWVSEEPWGHITYHYGSWVDYPGHGWLWVPGRVWAPAWVAWRVGGGFVGWAPLPPAACRRDIPVADAVVLRIPTPYFCFVGEREFGDQHIGRRMRPIQQNVTIIVQTRNSTHIEFTRTTVVNRSLSIEQVERMTGRRPQEIRLERSDDNHDAERRHERGEPVAYHPRPQPRTPGAFEMPRNGHEAPPSRAETPRIPPPASGFRPGDHELPKPPVAKPPIIVPPGLPTPRSPVPAPPIRVPRPPVVHPVDPIPAKPVPQPTPKPPQPGNWLPLPARQEVPAPDKSKSPVARPAGPEPRPADPQPAPKPARDRGNSDAPSAERPIAPPAVRPADPPQRRADPEPTPTPERRHERAPEPPSPPVIAHPADPAPRKPEMPARSQPSESPQRRQPAPADNAATDDQTILPGQTPDSSGKGGSSRRGGR